MSDDAIRWEGGLDDDCHAEWRGLVLCAEDMGEGGWWWAVYRDREEFASSRDRGERVPDGESARAQAERAARDLDAIEREGETPMIQVVSPESIERARRAVVIDYTNYRGERSMRAIVPIDIHFGESEWHPEPQWLLTAFDLGKDAERTFAMKDIHSWKPAGGETQR